MITQHYEKGNLQYVDRDRYIENNINTEEKIAVPVVFNKDTANSIYEINIDSNDSNSPLQKLVSLSEIILSEINQLKEGIGIYVQEIKEEENLLDLEAALLEKYEEVKNLNDSLINVQHDNIAGFNVNSVLRDFAEKLIKDYSNLPTTEEKVAQVEPALACLNQLESLILKLEKVPEETHRFRDAYTNRVFNPYTFTYMEETLKQPIFRSFNEVLLPGIFNNFNILSCENIQGFSKNFDTIFDDMIRNLTQNTRREERKIRKAKSAPKAAEILSLNLHF
jgi:hypothetical protein